MASPIKLTVAFMVPALLGEFAGISSLAQQQLSILQHRQPILSTMSERHKEPALDMDITDTIATTSRAMVEKHRHFDPGHDGDIKRQSPDKRFSDTTEVR